MEFFRRFVENIFMDLFQSTTDKTNSDLDCAQFFFSTKNRNNIDLKIKYCNILLKGSRFR